MTNNVVILDKNKHKHLRVITTHSAEFGDNINFVPVLVDELKQLVLEYPVYFIKDPHTGQFALQTLLGFEQNENLFLQGNQWQADYLPVNIKIKPFMFGIKGNGVQPSPENTVVTIDTASPRVQEQEGEILFDQAGNLSPYLSEITTLLHGVVPSLLRTQTFIQALVEQQLICPIQQSITTNVQTYHLDGFYTVDLNKLKELPAALIQNFMQQGYLEFCYLLSASLGNINKLVGLKNQ